MSAGQCVDNGLASVGGWQNIMWRNPTATMVGLQHRANSIGNRLILLGIVDENIMGHGPAVILKRQEGKRIYAAKCNKKALPRFMRGQKALGETAKSAGCGHPGGFRRYPGNNA